MVVALNKKGGFGIDLAEQFKDVESVSKVEPADTHTHTDTDKHTHTDTDTHADTDIPVKETRSKRLYLLAQPTVHQKLSQYAKAKGDTFNNLVHELMEKFIEEKGL